MAGDVREATGWSGYDARMCFCLFSGLFLKLAWPTCVRPDLWLSIHEGCDHSVLDHPTYLGCKAQNTL